ncbi:MAG: enoyl-CoA hydratase/isomerase family protein [Cumulibacter sp.]
MVAVVVTTANRVATVSFNRPEKLNAIGEDTVPELIAALTDIAGRDDIGAVVLTGEGTSFSAGLDLESDFGGSVTATYERLRTSVAAILLMREMPQPIIAAVRGHAVGGGFANAVACDMRIVSADARFLAPFSTIGMSAGDLGLTWLLPRLIGAGAAAKAFYAASPIDAQEALTLGLAEEIAEDPRARAIELAEEIAAKPAFGVRHTKELLNASVYGQGFREHLETEMRSQVICSMSEDFAAAKERFAGNRKK